MTTYRPVTRGDVGAGAVRRHSVTSTTTPRALTALALFTAGATTLAFAAPTTTDGSAGPAADPTAETVVRVSSADRIDPEPDDAIHPVLAELGLTAADLDPSVVERTSAATPLLAAAGGTATSEADEEPDEASDAAAAADEPADVATDAEARAEEAADEGPLTYVGGDGEHITAERIRSFLAGRGAPLAEQAELFVAAGVEHDVDPRLVVGIAIAESNGGKRLPPGSHNAWGWGGSGSHGLAHWSSWEAAIDDYTERLGRLYDTEHVGESFARTYCPPNWRWWLDTVTWTMGAI
jgi:hypothetical protein